MNNEFPQSETDRMLSGMLMFGTVEAVDHDNARVRVRSGDWVSAWLPWGSQAAGEVRHWRPPSIGEQALILSPSGRPEQAGVIPGFYTTQHAAPSNDGKTVLWELPADFTFIIRVGATTLTVSSDGVHVQGNIIASGDILNDGTNSNHHQH